MKKRALTFGEVLRARRESAGVSLRAAAAHLGITPSYLHDIEYDRRGPLSPKRIRELSSLIPVTGLEARARQAVVDAALARWEREG